MKRNIKSSVPQKRRSPSTGVVVSGGANVPALYDEELAKAAAAAASRLRVPTGGNRVSIKGKVFSVAGSTIGDTLPVSIVEFGYVKAYYEGIYNEKDPQPPVCFALNLAPDNLAPHPIAPKKQHGDCATCPKNAFGSATTGSGRGKACKDVVRLVILHADDLESSDTVLSGKLATLDLPAMSLRGWQEYSNGVVRKMQRELLAFQTTLSFSAANAYPVVEFKLDGPLADPSVIGAIKSRQSEAQEMILKPWEPTSDKPKAEISGRATVSRKAEGRKSRFS